MSAVKTISTEIPPGTVFRDGPLLPEMVAIAPGTFWMGANDQEDKFASILEKPRHWVRIPAPIAVGKFPVTFEQWDAFCEDHPDAYRPDDNGYGRGKIPVYNVSWEDAQAYVSWLSANTGRSYRLPSEAEWEYCCRAGSSSVFAEGSDISVNQANFLYMDFGGRPGVGRPVAVGSYPPNAYGLCDMEGNVCELVADSWHDTYQGAPGEGEGWEGTNCSMWRVVRGGGWDGLPRILRCAFRDWVHHNQRADNMGFRVACDL
jgi:formylglycine-generating enzyme required for sulfatase activity